LLREYRDYRQYKNTQGEWDRETLRATLQAKALAARYLLMNENPATHAETTAEELSPNNANTPLRLEDFHPGESFASYYGRRADAAIARMHQAEEEKRQAEERERQAEERDRKNVAGLRVLVTWQRQQGRTDLELANDLGFSLEEFLELCPHSP
jgi:hypothetical protein